MARKKSTPKLTTKEINQARELARQIDQLNANTQQEVIQQLVNQTGTKIGRMKDPEKIIAKVKKNHEKYMNTHNISKPLRRGVLDDKGYYTSDINPNYRISKKDFDAYEKEVDKARAKLQRLRGNEIFGMIFGDIPYGTNSKGKPLYNTTLDDDFILFKNQILDAKSPMDMKDSSWLNNRMNYLKRFNSKSYTSNYTKQAKSNLMKGLLETGKTTVIGRDDAEKIAMIVKNMTNKEVIQLGLIIKGDGGDLFKIIYEHSADDITEYLDKLYSQASDVKRYQAQQRRVSKLKTSLQKKEDD